jgi:hypothetical protein
MAKDKEARPEADRAADAAGEPAARRPLAAEGRRAGGVPEAGGAAQADVADFIEKMRSMVPAAGQGRGRLVFAMDATMSRQPTWDMAQGIQADMFEVVRDVGELDVQLVYFRGAGECRASRWVSEPQALARLMTAIECRGGYTQIGKVLGHVRRESETARVNALVYVGDCMEESVDDLCGRAGELALLGVPVFLFQEGRDKAAEQAFREIARLTKGAWCRFDQGSAAQLRELLRAVAVYAAGGRRALERLADATHGGAARRLLQDMSRG